MFDSGQCKIYTLGNTAQPGDMPKEGLVYSSSHWFEELTIGITRFYSAMQNNCKVDMLIRTWQDRAIDSSMICIIQDDDPAKNKQYRIIQVQHSKNKDGINVTDISLERLGDVYAIS